VRADACCSLSHARKTKIPIDTLKFKTEVLKLAPGDCKRPEKGALIYGLYLQGGSWSFDKGLLLEAQPAQLFCQMPVVWYVKLLSFACSVV
jgi:dynein heavy chain